MSKNIGDVTDMFPEFFKSLMFTDNSGSVGLAARTSSGILLEKYTITSPEFSSKILGGDTDSIIVNKLISIMFKNGAKSVTVIPVESESDYFSAFSSLLRCNVASVTYDMPSELAADSLAELLAEYSEQFSSGCIGVCPLEINGDETAPENISKPSSSRICAVLTPEAAAAAAAAVSLPHNINKSELAIAGVDQECVSTGAEAQLLITAGISPVLCVSDGNYILNCISTDVSQGKARPICYIMAVDSVIGTLRTRLNSMYRSSPDGKLSCREIKYAARSVLVKEREAGIISSFGQITSEQSDKDDMLVLNVSFVPACGLERIYVTAEIYFK